VKKPDTLFLFFKNIDAMFLFLSILTVNIEAMLLNLDPDIFRSGPRLHSTCSKQFSSFIVFLNNKIMMCYYFIFNDMSNTLHM
jgi:hypothetical protein